MMPRVILVGALTIAAVAAVYGVVPRPLGAAFVLAFLFVTPGLAWMSWLDDLTVAETCVVSVGLSLALDIVVGCLLVFGLWSPQVGFAALVAATAAGLLCTGRRDEGG
jgi:hypothetical protein